MLNFLRRYLFGARRKRIIISVLLVISFLIGTLDVWVNFKTGIFQALQSTLLFHFYSYRTGRLIYTDEQDPEITKMLKNQKCRIPTINPFNEEILPYLRNPVNEKCRLKHYAKVRDNIVSLNTTGMEYVELSYIRRAGDSRIEYFGLVELLPRENGEKEEAPSFITHKIEHEFFMIRIFFTDQSIPHKEYHTIILRRNNTKETGKESENTERVNGNVGSDQLNILIVMFDSVSTAHAQRSLKRSYRYLKEHKRTVIMKGHSIVGDGTTSQLCAMLTGTAEGDLPEARKGWANSTSVDVWPWIFKDLHAKNYVTFFSEHDIDASTFNYRLHGFVNPPTTHYLRPLWYAMYKYYRQHSDRCYHQFNFNYTRRFFDVYKDKSKFGFVVNNIAHNTLRTLEMADDDIFRFYKWLENSEFSKNTLVILMGDHGQRTSDFRKTLHGKLEERLPLFAITYPSKFDVYKDKLENLRRNSHLLTSHFDTYATLQHLLTFPKRNKKMKNKYGRSLFTNLETLNRTCGHAGVAKHWCTCLNYEQVDPRKDGNVEALAKTVINYMNNLNSEKTTKCSELKLDRIIQSGRRIPNEEVNQFLQTETLSKGCDSCAVKYSEKKKSVTRYEYELSFAVKPSGGTYEVVGEVVYKNRNVFLTHSSDISRTNLYGNQPACIAKQFPHLRKFCYCRQRKK